MSLIKDRDVIRPIDEADAYIMQRFRLEPRFSLSPARSWVIAYDKLKKEYLKEIIAGKKTRRYIQFYDSDEFIKYMRKRFTGPKEASRKE